MSLTISYGCRLFLTVSQVPWSCYMSLPVSHSYWLSLTVFQIPCSCCMSLTAFYDCWLSLTVSPVLWSCCMSLTVSYGCWLSLPVSLVQSSFYMSLFVSSCSMELLHAFHYLPRAACCLSLSLIMPWSRCMSFTVSCGCWLSLTVSPVPWSS